MYAQLTEPTQQNPTRGLGWVGFYTCNRLG